MSTPVVSDIVSSFKIDDINMPEYRTEVGTINGRKCTVLTSVKNYFISSDFIRHIETVLVVVTLIAANIILNPSLSMLTMLLIVGGEVVFNKAYKYSNPEGAFAKFWVHIKDPLKDGLSIIFAISALYNIVNKNYLAFVFDLVYAAVI